MKAGDVYVRKFQSVKNDRVQITRVYDVDEYIGDDYISRTIIDFMPIVNGSLFGLPEGLFYEEFEREFRELNRQPHCYKCKKDLDEKLMDICNVCNGIICPDDKACLCDYIKYSKSRN